MIWGFTPTCPYLCAQYLLTSEWLAVQCSSIRRSAFALASIGFLLLPLLPAGAKENVSNGHGKKIEHQYVVQLKDGSDPDTASVAVTKKHGGGVLHVYKYALKGFAAELSDEQVQDIAADPLVASITPDYEVEAFGGPTAQAQVLPTGVDRIDAEVNANKGSGVGVAVIDTGISLKHPDLGPVVNGKNCIKSRTADDDNGHGSHVAGIIAARDNGVGVVGVAPAATLIAVKVLNANGAGSWSSVICGIDWVTANAAKYNIKVANMSLGGGGTSDNNCGTSNNDALHKALCRSRDAGVTYVVAAGNAGGDASTFVPAAYDDAVITVSALADSDGAPGGAGSATGYGGDDTFASFSNFGSVVDLGAPGVDILSTWKGSGYATISGTSMASPHVAGAAALYIKSHPGSLWTQVRDGLKAAAETLGLGHTDPSGLHPEPVVKAGNAI